MASSTSSSSSSSVIGNAPLFWAALIGVGVLWQLAPSAHSLLIWLVVILLVGLVLAAWPTISANLGTALGESTTTSSAATAKAAGRALGF